MIPARAKMHIYMMIVSLIMSLIGIAVVKMNQNTVTETKPMTTSQKFDALESVAPQSPEMKAFLKQQRAAQESNDEAADALK